MISPLCYSPSLLPPPSSPFLRRPVPLDEYAKKGGGPGSDKLPEAKKAAAPKAADREEEEEEEEGGGGGGEWLWPAMSKDAAEVSSAHACRANWTSRSRPLPDSSDPTLYVPLGPLPVRVSCFLPRLPGAACSNSVATFVSCFWRTSCIWWDGARSSRPPFGECG